MLTIKDGKKILTTPVSAEDLKDIHIGDVVYLNGDLTTCRDVAHRRLVEEGRPLPVDVKDAAIFHAGPIIRPLENDKFEMVSVGPTTSMRMEKFEYEFIKHTGVRVIVGKGGMGPNTERGCKEFGAIHCVFPAGCAMVRTSSKASCVFLRHASALLSLSQRICTLLTISFATAIILSWFSAWRVCFQLISNILSSAYMFCDPVISTPSS